LLKPPVIHQVQCRDTEILVEASDHVIVAKVVITILEDDGKLLEKGEAWDLARNSTMAVLTRAMMSIDLPGLC